MADFSTNISNAITVSGLGETYKWGSLVWGEGEWLGPKSLVLESTFYRLIAESLGVADAVTLTATFSRLISENVGLSDSVEKTLLKLISNGIAGSTDRSVSLKRGIWNILFPGETIDATERSIPDYEETLTPTTAWTSSAVSATSWTEL